MSELAAPATVRDLPPGDDRWAAAFGVLAELRPHLTPDALEAVLTAGSGHGPQFIGAFAGDDCLGVAGFRLIINTSAGRKLYVDDLVVTPRARSTGIGSVLLAELIDRARGLDCVSVELDSGVQRFDAHRFYLRHGFQIRSHHFTLSLAAPSR